jgi:hypothetical protein
MTVRPLRALGAGEREAVTEEATALLAFLHPCAAAAVRLG